MMRSLTLCLLTALALLGAACSAPENVVVVPTLAALPTLTDAPTITATTTATETALPTVTPAEVSPQSLPTDTPTDLAPPTATETAIPTTTPTVTPTETITPTFTPSLTITNTVTFTPSPTYTPTLELEGIGMLAMLIDRATILPPEVLYNPQTLTAVYDLGRTLVAQTQFPVAAADLPPAGGTPAAAIPGGVACALPPPGGLGAIYAADPALAAALGCPIGGAIAQASAVQTFERGIMIYLDAAPGTIYALTPDGRYRQFADTWVSGVDPESGGELPPPNLFEPRRGFGKVWRQNADIRAALGWAIMVEAGATASVLTFERGRAVYLPQRGETFTLANDGSWRIFGGVSF